MALLNNLQIRYSGSTTDAPQYWRVADIAISYEQKRATANVCSYHSQEAAKGTDERGRAIKPMERKTICIKDEALFDKYFGLDILEGDGQNPVKSFYNYIKENIKEFEGSSDI